MPSSVDAPSTRSPGISPGQNSGASGLLAGLRARFGDVVGCPTCGGEPRASADDRAVTCGGSCGRVLAAARDGVLDFASPMSDDRGSQSGFGYQWEKVLRGKLDEQIVYNNTPEDLWHGLQEWMRLPDRLDGWRTLDVGCGHGQYCRVLADRGAKAMGCDLSEVVYRATAENAASPRPRETTFVRCDILDFPLRARSFDLVLSIGMAHHTPDTKRAVMAAAECVAPGGQMLLYIYELGPGGVGYITLRHRFPLPGMLPRPLMLLTCKLMSVPLAFGLAARRRKLPDARTFQAAFLGLVDAYLPTYSDRRRPEECILWLREAGLAEVKRVAPCFFYGRRPR
ncbi:MAG: class I SAM-dependent methyltransferase [Phycisphaerales bacterium]